MEVPGHAPGMGMAHVAPKHCSSHERLCSGVMNSHIPSTWVKLLGSHVLVSGCRLGRILPILPQLQP